MKELKEEIKSRSFKNCYLFFGEEKYLIRTYEQRMRSALLEEGSKDMNFSVFDGKKVLAEDIIGACETLPFLAEKRLVLVKDSALFKQGRKEESERLSKYMADIPQSTVLLFIESEVDKRSQGYKAAAKYGRAVEFITPAEKELSTWIVGEFKKSGIGCGTRQAVYLIESVAYNMEAISAEIEKLKNYKAKGNIANEDIDRVCIKSLETRIFEMVDAIGNKKAGRAVEIYRNLLSMKEAPLGILMMITRQFRLMLECAVLSGQGLSEREIAARIGQKEFVVRKSLGQSRNFDRQILTEAMRDCLETDRSVKSGMLKPAEAVELIIIKYSSKQ